MSRKIVVSDYFGILIRVLLCCIIWYKEAIQNKYYQGSNVFLILGVLLTIVVFMDYYSRRQRYFRVSKIAWRYFIYLIVTFALGFISSHRISDHISYGVTVIEFSLIMLYICYYSNTRGNLDFLVWNFALVYLFMTIVFLLNPSKLLIGGVVRYSYSADTNPNSFAISMTTGIWTLLYLIAKRRLKLLIGLPICGVMLYAIFLTGARKGLIAALLCFSFWFLLYYIPINEKGSTALKIWKTIVTVFIVFMMAVVLIPYFSESVVAQRLLGSGRDTSIAVRLGMYRIGLDYLNNSPIVGHGFWGFSYFYGAYSHSTWVEAFVSSGYLLGLLFVSIYIKIGKSLIRLYRNRILEYENRVIISQYLVLYLTLLFYSIVIIHFYDLCVMICIGMIISSIDITEKVRSIEKK